MNVFPVKEEELKSQPEGTRQQDSPMLSNYQLWSLHLEQTPVKLLTQATHVSNKMSLTLLHSDVIGKVGIKNHVNSKGLKGTIIMPLDI